MAQNTTRTTDVDPAAFVAAIEDPVRRRDAERVLELMALVTGEPARMWGASIVGFGEYHYRYASGREDDWLAVGFSPRKQATTLYLADGLEAHADALARLGRHTTGKGCVNVKDLDAVDLAVLEEIVRASYESRQSRGADAD